MSKEKVLTQEQIDRFNRSEERKQRLQKRRLDKQEYLDLIDKQIEMSFPALQFVSEQLKTVKKGVYLNFKLALELKKELFGERIDQNQTHTFTHSDGKKRILLITYFVDDWDDTITAGLDLVKQRLETYSVDENSTSLVKQLLRLISKNSKGELKVSSVLQFRRFAEERNDEQLIDAVSLIEQAYRPTFSKTSIRVEVKNDVGAWVNVPLSATEAYMLQLIILIAAFVLVEAGTVILLAVFCYEKYIVNYYTKEIHKKGSKDSRCQINNMTNCKEINEFEMRRLLKIGYNGCIIPKPDIQIIGQRLLKRGYNGCRYCFPEFDTDLINHKKNLKK